MELLVNYLYLCLAFPIWTCLLILVNTVFTSLNSKKMAYSFTACSIILPAIFSVVAVGKNFVYENNINILQINDIIFNFGLSVNRLSSLFVLVFEVCLYATIVLAYKKYQDNINFLKYLLLLNLINIGSILFFFATNLLQLFVLLMFVPVIFYIIENMINNSHERAKNFLVINKIADFTMLIPVCAFFYYSVLFTLMPDKVCLQITDLDNLFETIYSITELPVFILISVLFFIGLLMKSVLIFIHPLKGKCNLFLLASWALLSCGYLLILCYPLLTCWASGCLILAITGITLLIVTLIILYLKYFKHTFVEKVNNVSVIFVKNIYLKIANSIKKFDDYVLNRIYDAVSSFTGVCSGIFKISAGKSSLWSLIFNIAGILLLILIMWIIYKVQVGG